MPVQRILVGSTQAIVSYPRVSPAGAALLAQPSSVTVRVGTPAVSTSLATYEAATVDNVSTTLENAAVEGDTTLTLAASTALVRGRRYIVAAAAGPVEVEHIGPTGSSTTVYLAEPLPCAIEDAAAFVGYAVSHALTSTETANPGNALALWRAVVDGVTYEWAQPFRVARRIPVCPLRPTQLTQAYPVVHTLRARTDTTLDEVIASAWHYRVLRALEAKGVQEEDIISVDVLEPLVAIACVLQLVMQDPVQPNEFVARIAEDYQRTLDAVLASRHWYEDHQSEAPAPKPEGETANPVRGALRLTR